MYVCTCMYVHVCMYMYVCTCMYVHMYVHVQYVCMYMYIMYMYVRTCMYVDVHVHNVCTYNMYFCNLVKLMCFFVAILQLVWYMYILGVVCGEGDLIWVLVLTIYIYIVYTCMYMEFGV